jgi:integrase/recombinase XerD
LVRLLFYLGCRISELLATATDDVDLDQGFIVIQHLKQRLKLSCPGCGNNLAKNYTYCAKCGIKVDEAVSKSKEHLRKRSLPIDRESLSLLRDYFSHGGPVRRDGKELIFGINRHRAWQIVKECAEKARLPRLTNPETGRSHNVSPHRLRDAFAVHAVKLDDSGDGLRLLQEHLGHASFNTTARYRKVSGQEHRDWYQKLWKSDQDEKNGQA